MQGGSDGALGDLLSGFSTPARPESSAAKPEIDKDILDLFGPTSAPASGSKSSASHSGHPPPAQQIPGSRASSVAYEDAASRSFTPETAASLLDFDTPFASPTSPASQQAWQAGPSILGRSAMHGAHGSPHLPPAPGHDPFLHSSQAQQVPGAARVQQASLGTSAPELPSSRHTEQAEHVSNSHAGPSHAELRLHDSSSTEPGPVVHLGEFGDPALGRAGSGLSLSDGDASASVLSSLGEGSDFGTDLEHSADAAALEDPNSVGQHLSPMAKADLADAARHASSSAPALDRRRIPSSPFQHDSALDLRQTQAALVAGPSMQSSTGPETSPSLVPGAALHQRLSKLSEQPSEATSAASLQEAGGLRSIQAAGSDLMEAWNEQEQLDKQSMAAPQLHSRLSLEASDLALLDLAELEQASSILESMVESAELLPHQHSSLGTAPRQLLSNLQQGSGRDAGTASGGESQYSRQAQASHAADSKQHMHYEQHHGTGLARPMSTDKGFSAGHVTEDTVPSELLDSDSMQPGIACSSAEQHPSVSSLSSAGDTTPNTPVAYQASIAMSSSMPVGEASHLRPADNAFRERREPETAHEHSRRDLHQGTGSAGDAEPAASIRHSEQPEEAQPVANAVEQCAGRPSSPSLWSDGEQPDTDRAAGLGHDTEHAANSHAQPDLAVPGQAGLQHAAEATWGHGQAGIALGSVPNSTARPHKSAEPSQGADKLAHAEALERALATGAAPATMLVNDKRHLAHDTLLTRQRAGTHSEDAAQPSMDPLLRVRQRLAQAGADWPPGGRLGPRGSTVGGSLCMRVDSIAALQQAATNYRTHGAARVVACFHGVAALGMSGGAAFVLLPRGLSAEGSPEVSKLGEPRAGDDVAVSALAFSPLGNILAVGHANGDIAFWELRRTGWECGKLVKDAHVTTVVACTFLEASSSTERTTALSCDSRGRLVFHNVTGYLSITNFIAGRLAKSTQQGVLLDGRQLGTLCHLAALRLPPRSASKAAPDDAARQLFFQDGGSPFDGLVLMCSAKGAYVGRVLPEGRLTLLHNIPRPPDTLQGCLPYAAWRASHPGQTVNKRVGAALALGWAQQVLLLDVPLVRPNADATADGQVAAADSAAQQTAMSPTVVQSWSLDHPVIGLAWLEGPGLAVVQEKGTRTLIHLYNQQGTQVLERLDLDDSLIPNQHLALPGSSELSYTSVLASAPERMMLLTTQGVRTARLMTWQERLATLRDIGRWDHALLLGLSLLEAARAPASQEVLLLRGVPRAGRAADPKAIGDALWSLVLGYLDANLPGSTRQGATGSAGTAVDLCLGLDRRALLWEDVVPRFQQAGVLGALLDCLLPRIMAGQLQSLAPEVMQALVEQCAAAGKVADVERCVLRLDLATLDFNQVTRLCRMHQLHSALAFLFTRALSDYAAPAAELLLAHIHGVPADEHRGHGGSLEQWDSGMRTGYKLLVYLKCGLGGEAFPPGTGEVPTDIQATVKLQLLAFLLFSTLESVHRLAAAFGGGDDEYATDESAQALLPGPHAALRCLIRLDAGAVLKILKQALASWDATESDLADAASIFMVPPPEAFQSACSAAQAVVNALIRMVQAERPQPGQDPALSHENSALAGGFRAQALAFVADFVTAGRATAQLQDTMPILECLAEHGEDGALHSQEESFAAVLLSAVAGRPESDAEADGVLRRALQLARAAGYMQAQAQVYHSMGNYKQALQCYLDSQDHPQAAFRYIDAAINGGPSVRKVSHTRLPAFKAVVMDAMPRLVERDSSATAGIVLSSFPQEHAAVVRQLQGSPNLQYMYLKAALQETAARAEQAADSPSKVASESAAAGAHEALLAQHGVGELYVRLLCQFEPGSVLPFLQSHDAYRVEEVLPYTERFGVADAQGYLLERLGDVTSALAIYCDAADRANDKLVAAILAGSLPLGSLPVPAQARLARAGSVQEHSEGQSNLARLFASGTAENRAAKESEQTSGSSLNLLADAQAALKGAVSLCKRHSRDAAPAAAQELWFMVLQRYVAPLRHLRQLARQQSVSPAPPEEARCLAAAPEALTAFMEDVISHMAGYVPLKAIAERILASYASDPFGDFKGILVGLLAAFSYELSILHTASRLTSADAFRTLHTLYRERTHPVALSSASMVPSSTVEAMQDEEGAQESSSSARTSRRRSAFAGVSPLARPPQTHRLQLLSDLNAGGLVVNSRSMGLFLAPAADKMRSPPPPALASVPGSARPGSGQERAAAQTAGRAGRLAGSGANFVGPSIDPQSPAHRGGIDINYLRLHDLHL